MKVVYLCISILLSTLVGFSQISVKRFKKLSLEKKRTHIEKEMGYVFIPSGLFNNDPQAWSYTGDTDLKTSERLNRREKVDSFYISKYECSNDNYNTYLFFLKGKWKQDGYSEFVDSLFTDFLNGHSWEEMYQKALPKHGNWIELDLIGPRWEVCRDLYEEPHPDYYYRPVVNVTRSQVQNYCKWLTIYYNTYPEIFEAKKLLKKVRFRLPTAVEWEYAALGGRKYATTPWGYHDVFNDEGQLRANIFYRSPIDIYLDTVQRVSYRGDTIKSTEQKLIPHQSYEYGAELKKVNYEFRDPSYTIEENRSCLVLPVDAFPGHGYGIHQMAGNVREFVGDKKYTKGGSWELPGAYVSIKTNMAYPNLNYSAPDVGFRLVMDIIEY